MEAGEWDERWIQAMHSSSRYACSGPHQLVDDLVWGLVKGMRSGFKARKSLVINGLLTWGLLYWWVYWGGGW